MLLQATQQFESEISTEDNLKSIKENNCPTANPFGQPLNKSDIQCIKERYVAKNTAKHTDWAQQIWQQWATERLQLPMNSEDNDLSLEVDITKMTTIAINYWLQQFVVEVRKGNGEHYSPDSLHQICCSLQKALRAAGNTA